MNETTRSKMPLNAVSLRMLALFVMLLDHLWATVIPGNDWMTHLGRMAFPIFAFQVVEGFYHTSDFKRYAKRLLFFAILSEIPFNLIQAGSPFFPFMQNVMFTLLLGLLALRSMEKLRTADTWKQRIRSGLAIVGFCLLGAVGFVDYGLNGVLTVLLFGLARYTPWEKAVQLLGMMLIHVVMMKGRMLILGPLEIPYQSFAVLALIPIWLYNGEKGPRNKAIQYGSYLFYPVHMLIIYLIWYFT